MIETWASVMPVLRWFIALTCLEVFIIASHLPDYESAFIHAYDHI